MRRVGVPILGVAAVGLVAMLVAALVTQRPQAFTLGVTNGTTVKLLPGHQACQSPIAVPQDAAFDGVRVVLGTAKRPGPPVDVTVRAQDGGALLARGRLAGGYPDIDRAPQHVVWLPRVRGGQTVRVCLRDAGSHPVFAYANTDAAARTSQASLDGKPYAADLNLAFQRRQPRSLLALLPAMLRRAALFRAGWVGTWTYVLLAVIVVVAVPALLVRALLRAGTAQS